MKRVKKILASILAFVMVITVIPIDYAYAVNEHDYTREITINLDGGYSDGMYYMTQVDRAGEGHSAGAWLRNLGVDNKVKDRKGVTHTVVGYKNTEYPKEGTFTLRADAVGVTPHVVIEPPTRAGYTFTGWNTNTNYMQKDGSYYFEVGCYSPDPINITACWNQDNTYMKVNWDSGVSSVSGANQWYTAGSTATLTASFNSGYEFDCMEDLDNGAKYYANPDTWGMGSNRNVYVHSKKKKYTFDVNGWLDGSWNGGTSGYGTFDVYINGELINNDTTDAYAEKSIPYGSTYEIKDIKATTGHTYNGVHSGSIKGTITGDTSVDLDFSTNTYTVNQYHYKLHPPDESHSESYWVHFDTTTTTKKYGESFAPYNVGSPTGYHAGNNYGYYDSSDKYYSHIGDGTVGTNSFTVDRNISVHVHYYPNTYTNTIQHWMWGFKNQDGNNVDKNAFHIKDTTFNADYDSTYIMDSSKGISVPNGFGLIQRFGTGSISGSWTDYNFGTSVTQKAYNMGYEYDYYPTIYSITYNMNGGTNNSSNPTSYNVLYGVTLNNPTRTGYTFLGWKDANGNIVSGINKGANASFTSADDMYDKLKNRTTGNQILNAQWKANVYTIKFNANTPDTYNGYTQNTKATHNATVTESQKSVTYNEKIGAMPEGKLTGWTFTGWYKDSLCTEKVSEDMIYSTASDTEVYAGWKANNYEVRLYPDKPEKASGTVLSKDNGWKKETDAEGKQYYVKSFTYDTVSELYDSSIFYSIIGWTDKDWLYNGSVTGTGTKKWNFVSKNGGIAQLTPVWTENEYYIRYDTNGGTTVNEVKVKYEDEIRLADAPARYGYKFLYWSTKKDGSGTIYNTSVPVKKLISENNGSIQLYGIWKKRSTVVAGTVTVSANKQMYSFGKPLDIKAVPKRVYHITPDGTVYKVYSDGTEEKVNKQ